MVDSKPMSDKYYCEEVISASPAAVGGSFTPEIQVTTVPGHPSSQVPAKRKEEGSYNYPGHFRNPAAAAALALRPSSASTSSGIGFSTSPSHQISTNIPRAVRRHVRNLSLPPASRHVQDSAAPVGITGMDASLTMSNWHVQDQSLSPSRCVGL